MPGENWNPYAEAGDEEEEARAAEAEARKRAEEEERRAEELKKIFGSAEGGMFGFSPEAEDEDEEAGNEEEGGIFSGLGEAVSEGDEDNDGEPEEEADSILDIDHGSGNETSGEEDESENGESQAIEEEPVELEAEIAEAVEEEPVEEEVEPARAEEPTGAETIESQDDSAEEEVAEQEAEADEPAEEIAPVPVEEEPAPAEDEPAEDLEPTEAEQTVELPEAEDTEEEPIEAEEEPLEAEEEPEGPEEISDMETEEEDTTEAGGEDAQEVEDSTAEDNEPEPIPEEEVAAAELAAEEEDHGRIPEHMPHKAEIPLDEAETEAQEQAEAEVVAAESEDEQPGADEAEPDLEAEEMLREEKNARERVLDEFRKQQEAVNEAQAENKAEKPAARPNKGPKEYMDEMAPAILVGSFVNDLSRGRDRKLGRRIDEANRDIEQIKSNTADAIEAGARRAEKRQAMHDEERIEQQTGEQDENTTVERHISNEEALLDNRDEKHESAIREGEADESAEISSVAAAEAPGEERSGLSNQEFSGQTDEYINTEGNEEISVETLASSHETDAVRHEELSFDERQERVSLTPPDDDTDTSIHHGQSENGAKSISDILNYTHRTSARSADLHEVGSDTSLISSEVSSTAKEHESAIKAGVIAGLTVAVLIAAFLIFG
ncbi:MAG TPA: hypothetical protein VFW77_00690 [Candidatus Saccharimonadales bacterium]|nr:hypothetical protein [Candidatus Saccharimonadales bacterium]